MAEGITHLIINSPYDEPMKFWQYERQTRSFKIQQGKRRAAGYVTATPALSIADFENPSASLVLLGSAKHVYP